MTRYCEIYDSYYNHTGNWTENVCSDPKCEFCGNRPKKHPKKCPCKGKTKEYMWWREELDKYMKENAELMKGLAKR